MGATRAPEALRGGRSDGDGDLPRDLITSLEEAQAGGRLQHRLKASPTPTLLTVDEVGIRSACCRRCTSCKATLRLASRSFAASSIGIKRNSRRVRESLRDAAGRVRV